jgi:hypothetical protein
LELLTRTQSKDVNLVDKSKEFETKEVQVAVQVSEDLGKLQSKVAYSNVKDGVKLDKKMWGKLRQKINIATITLLCELFFGNKILL